MFCLVLVCAVQNGASTMDIITKLNETNRKNNISRTAGWILINSFTLMQIVYPIIQDKHNYTEFSAMDARVCI